MFLHNLTYIFKKHPCLLVFRAKKMDFVYQDEIFWCGKIVFFTTLELLLPLFPHPLFLFSSHFPSHPLSCALLVIAQSFVFPSRGANTKRQAKGIPCLEPKQTCNRYLSVNGKGSLFLVFRKIWSVVIIFQLSSWIYFAHVGPVATYLLTRAIWWAVRKIIFLG